MTALEYMQAGKRVQVQKSKLRDVKQIASTLLLNVKPEDAPMFSVTIEDLLTALSIAEDIQMNVLPDQMKDTIAAALYKLKEEIAFLVFKHFSVNDFTFTKGDQIYTLIREVVKTQYIGGE